MSVQARRFLHTNLNTALPDSCEKWYIELFDLKRVMRSVSPGTPGEAFGIYQDTQSDTRFLYDHRGARSAISLEMVHWFNPPTVGTPYPAPWQRGLQTVCYAAPDIETIAGRAAAAGGKLVTRTDDALLLQDPGGVRVEVVEADVEAPESRYMRLVARDLEASLQWYSHIGFVPAAADFVTPGSDLWASEGDHEFQKEVAITLPDNDDYGIVLTAWAGPAQTGPSYRNPTAAGLYRMALSVDDVQATYAELLDEGRADQPPFSFGIPDTPFADGIPILFVRDPDEVLVELVERPRSAFKRQGA